MFTGRFPSQTGERFPQAWGIRFPTMSVEIATKRKSSLPSVYSPINFHAVLDHTNRLKNVSINASIEIYQRCLIVHATSLEKFLFFFFYILISSPLRRGLLYSPTSKSSYPTRRTNYISHSTHKISLDATWTHAM